VPSYNVIAPPSFALAVMAQVGLNVKETATARPDLASQNLQLIWHCLLGELQSTQQKSKITTTTLARKP